MIIEQIVPQSIGSSSIALIALLMTVIQLLFAFRKPRFNWYVWGALLSFAGMIYAAGIFLEYNTGIGPVKRAGGLLEFSAHIFMIHSLYGFTFTYLGFNIQRYHLVAGAFHIFLLVLLWFTPLIVSDRFVSHHFFGLAKPFVEADLGPLGPLFIFYIAGAAITAAVMWYRRKSIRSRHKTAYQAGMVFWLILGIHDGLAVLGLPTIQYLMEYGFLGFSLAVLWVVFDSYADASGEDKYHVITEFANDGILVLQDGKIVFENPACRTLFGCFATDSTPRDFVDHVARDDQSALKTYYRDVMDAKNVSESLIVRVVGAGGEEKYLEIRANPIIYHNGPALLNIIRDATSRIREAAVLKEQEEHLNRLKKMESLGLLAGGVAHDLNNVLSGIVSYPELMLLNLPEDSKLRKPLEGVQEAGLRAAAIVQDLLTIARSVAISKEPLDLNEIISSYVMSPDYKKLLHYHPHVQVRTQMDSQLLNIKGSIAHVRKALMNLVSNAAEAIETSGTVIISTENRFVERPPQGRDYMPAGEYSVLSVADDGPGISSEDIRQIFEPFYTKKVMGRSGTGLGLTVVWNVVETHDGFIRVQSDERGSRFELYFPVTRDVIVNKASSVSLDLLKGNGEMILVVDDMKSQRDISCMMLEALGYRAEAVDSGEKAVGYVKNKRVDLVLLDMMMDPGMDGRETYESILKIAPRQKAVIVSGFAETDQVKETLRMGAARYLKKPLVLEELARTLRDVFTKS